MKLLIISIGKMYGGAERYTSTVFEKLSVQHDVYVVIRKGNKLRYDLDKNKTIEIEFNLRHIWKSLIVLKKIIKEKNIDIVQCNGINAMFLGVFFSKVKKVAVVHGDTQLEHADKGWLCKYLFFFAEKIILKQYNNIIAVSSSLKNVLVKRGINSSKIKVIYNGIKMIKYVECKEHNEIMNVCCVGNLIPIKNQIILIKALNIVKEKRPNIKFKCDIYGEGNSRYALEKAIKYYKMDTEVYLQGFSNVIRDNMCDYDIYIQPSIYESFCLALVEAINAGCYCIASNVGGMIEIINIIKRGVLFKSNDPDDLAKKIIYFYDNKVYLNKNKDLDLNKLKENFSDEAMSNKMIKYFTSEIK